MKKSVFLFGLIIYVLVFIFLLEGVFAQDLLNNGSSKNINSVLSKNLNLSEETQIISKFLFGLKRDDRINFQYLSVMIALWIVLLMLIHVILSFTPFLGEGAIRSWFASFIITALVSFSGSLYQVTVYLFYLFNFVKFLEKSKIAQLIIGLIIIVLFFIGTSNLLNSIKKKEEIEQVRSSGFKLGSRI